MGYEKYYSGGWKSGETGGTPITPEALNHMEEGIEAAADHADSTSNPHGVTAAQVGAAASSHNHSTSNITSGTLGVARGGTGKATHTSNAVLTGNGTSAVNNVATASGALYATAADGAAKFGTLPIAQGGTGKTTAVDACSALGLSPAMNLGTVYTTREKYKNKTVYAVAVSLDLSTGSGNKYVAAASGLTELVSLDVWVKDGITGLTPNFASLASCYVNLNNGNFFVNSSAVSKTAYAFIKFVK